MSRILFCCVGVEHFLISREWIIFGREACRVLVDLIFVLWSKLRLVGRGREGVRRAFCTGL